jgi:putative FmdB family regulatory protein
MPLYEYRCRDCGHQFEIQQSLSDDTLSECPACAGALRKVFSPVGIAFKGSGFYKTDSRSSTGSGGGSSSSSGGGEGSDSPPSGSDASSGGSDTSSGGSGSTSTSSSDTAGSTASTSSS